MTRLLHSPPRLRVMLSGTAAVLATILLAAIFWHWPKLSFDWQSQDAQTASGYMVVIDGKPVAGIRRNLSGLSYRAATGTLLAVINRPAQLVELSTDGELLARYALDGLSDAEAVAWLDGDRVAIVGEAKSRVQLYQLHGGTLQLVQMVQLPERRGWLDNAGIEGLAWDTEHQRLILVQEKFPRRLSTLAFDTDGRLLDHCRDCTRQQQLRQLSLRGLRDLSSVELEAGGNALWLLSHESRRLKRFDLASGKRRTLHLRAGEMGLHEDIPQAEGFTLDSAGDLYIVSEPNLFYRFRRS